LEDDDPIKKWYAEGFDLNNLLIERINMIKNDKKPVTKKNFLKSKISDQDIVEQKEIPIIEENENNAIFR